MESVQQLYDKAFRHWEADEYDKSREMIDKALEISPGDISLHALAMHIKKKYFKEFTCLQHMEFIIDHDIHYNDTLNMDGNPHAFLKDMTFKYHFMVYAAGSSEKGEPFTEGLLLSKKEVCERAYTYTMKVLRAGYGIEDISHILEFMYDTERYDEIIGISYFIINDKTAEETGLPGLALSGTADIEENNYLDKIMDSFFYTGRNEEALLWCQKFSEAFPDDWIIHFYSGEVLCRLNRPAETAKQWIIALQQGAWSELFRERIDDFLKMIADKDFYKKTILYHRIKSLKNKIPPERKALYDKIHQEAYMCIGYSENKVLMETYIEGKLEIKLPPVEKEDYFLLDRIWLPKSFGPHPYLPPDKKMDSGVEKADISAVTPKTPAIKPVTIEKFGIDLTAQVKSGKYPPVAGRNREIDALIRILIRMEKNNPVLLGDAGVGKTAIIIGLAQRINAENVPSYLMGRRIIELSMSSLVGGTMWRGDFEQRITGIIKELRENKDIILFVDELHTIMGAGSAHRNDLDVANIIKPALAKGEIRLVGATTHREYSLYIEKDQAMARRFTPVRVAEMDRDATLEVLRYRVKFWLEHHKVNVPEETLVYAIDLTEHYIRHRRFPDKVIDLLDESCAFLGTGMENNADRIPELLPEHVNHVFKEWTGAVPVLSAETNPDKEIPDITERSALEGSLRKYIVAQNKAVAKLTTLCMQIRNNIKNPLLPVVSLFYGPAGTGKTTAARALSQTLWPEEQDRLMVLNMAEYSDTFSYHRLIGGPPGYSGYDEDGILSSRIKRKPFSVIVLKNLHEAHPHILGFFVSLFRNGMFSDKRGQDILAGDILFILHVDIETGKGTLGFNASKPDGIHNGYPDVTDMLKKKGIPQSLLKTYFHLFEFQPLSKNDMLKIVGNHLQQLNTVYLQKGITLKFRKSIPEMLTEKFSEMGGEKRNMEVLTDQYIVPLIREKLLESKGKTVRTITIGKDIGKSAETLS